MKNRIIGFILLGLFLGLGRVCAQEVVAKEPVRNESLKELGAQYFEKNDYDGFYNYLKNISEPDAEVFYYLALSRYKNIEHWKESKDWEGVYDKSENYKKEIADYLKLAEGQIKDDPKLLLKIKYLKWAHIKTYNSDDATGLFNDLVNTAIDIVKSAEALEVLKQIADGLSGLTDKNFSRRLYEVYASKIIKSEILAEDLKQEAKKFLEADNVYLAKTLFEAYLGKIHEDKQLWAREVVDIANIFAHNGRSESVDPVFAEAMYKKAFESQGAAAFDADSQYRRAFNFERMKEYQAAADGYRALLDNYADYAHKGQINFRLGVISAYAFRNLDEAIKYFLYVKEDVDSPLSLSALYQLGLLNQYSGNAEKAAEFYNACTEVAGRLNFNSDNNEICRKSFERLAEIEEKKDMKYALKLFLGGVFETRKSVTEKPVVEVLNVDLMAIPAKQGKGQQVRFIVTTSNPQTGCMMPTYAYEWSGETGSIENIPNSPELLTDYATVGIKVVNVAVVGPVGLDGVGFDMIEVE